MKEISLSQGKTCLVDDKDYYWLNKHKWTYMKGYAIRCIGGRKNRKYLYMHREILNVPDDLYTDHKDKNGLNNQRKNLRLVNKSQNMINSKISSRNTSGVRGVHLNTKISKYKDKVYKYKKWRANITVYGEHIYLGRFNTLEEATITRKIAEKEYWQI